MAGLERDLSTYYDQEASDRALRPLGSHRLERRRAFIELVHGEGRASVLEIGVGPGRDAAAFAESGVAPVGVDLSIEHARLDPPRFFSNRSHERARAMLARHGEIEQFDTWPDDHSTWEYQFAVLRVGGR
jgi:cyclopropane fatty-acyl-phospholipid synthase-like methyltransferase